MQTDDEIDAGKEKLSWEKELLKKEVSELKYEKTELHNRIQSLQSVSIFCVFSLYHNNNKCVKILKIILC